jgi:hypothetical protein
MTVNETLEKLIRDGCCCQPTGGSVQPVAAAGVLPDRTAWWCSPWPVDQSSAHIIPFETAKVYYDRDVGFFRGSELVLYFAPFVEWPDWDHNAYTDHWGRWQYWIAQNGSMAIFKEFVKDAIDVDF